MPNNNSKESYFDRKEKEEQENMDKAYKEYAKRLPFLRDKFLNDFTIDDAVWHYRLGNGDPVDVNLKSLDLSKVSVKDFKNTKHKYQGEPLLYVDFFLKYYTNQRQAIIYGSIGLVLIGPNRVMALPDTYDFDIKLNPGKRAFVRDFATLGGSFYNGSGKPYVIRFLGTSSISN